MDMSVPLKTVKVPEPVYRLLVEKAEKTGRKIQFLLERAILRCYGKA